MHRSLSGLRWVGTRLLPICWTVVLVIGVGTGPVMGYGSGTPPDATGVQSSPTGTVASHPLVTDDSRVSAASDVGIPDFTYSPTPATPGEPIQFDATALRTDVEGTITNASYQWQFGDGATATGPTPTHAFDEVGFHQVTVYAVFETESSGTSTVTQSRTVMVASSDQPRGTISVSPIHPTPGAALQLDASATPLPDGATDVSYSWSILTREFTGAEITYHLDGFDQFNASFFPVTFPVRLTVSGSTPDGPFRYVGKTQVTVYESPAGGGDTDTTPPSVEVSASPSPAVAGESVTFDATATDAGSIETYTWDFGDGASATGPQASHTYSDPGRYTVSVQVRDAAGNTNTVTTSVRVQPATAPVYDVDGDGFDTNEVMAVIGDITGNNQSKVTTPHSNATESNASTGNVSVESARETIDAYISNASTDDPLAGAPSDTVDTDGDGLSDWIEEQGVPVKQTYQLSDVGDDADVVASSTGDADDIVRLNTDPFVADTDGDGVSDSRELGAKHTNHRGQTYFSLHSDPTDANTDDAGIDDHEELKKGSNPTTPEWFTLSTIVPVVGQQDCSPGSGLDMNNCAKDVDGFRNPGPGGTYAVKAVAESNGNHQSKPWLQRIDPSKLHPESTYYLIQLSVNAKATTFDTRNLPEYVKVGGFGYAEVVGQGTSKNAIYDSDVVDPFKHGTESSSSIYVAVRADLREGAYKLLGNLRMKVFVPSDSAFARQSTSGQYSTVTVTSQSKFVVADTLPLTSEQEAKAMVEEATRKFGRNTIAAVAPVTGGALAAGSLQSLSSGLALSAELYAQGVALFTNVGNTPGLGPDDLVSKAIIGEGAVPAYLDREDSKPTANVAVTMYREN